MVLVKLAGFLGGAIRLLIRAFMLTVGPILLTYGVWLYSHPAGWIAAGVMLTVMNLQTKPSEGGK